MVSPCKNELFDSHMEPLLATLKSMYSTDYQPFHRFVDTMFYKSHFCCRKAFNASIIKLLYHFSHAFLIPRLIAEILADRISNLEDCSSIAQLIEPFKDLFTALSCSRHHLPISLKSHDVDDGMFLYDN